LERVNLDIVGDMKQKAIKYEKVEKYIKSKFQEATTGTSLLWLQNFLTCNNQGSFSHVEVKRISNIGVHLSDNQGAFETPMHTQGALHRF
jgi:hypothetical protein